MKSAAKPATTRQRRRWFFIGGGVIILLIIAFVISNAYKTERTRQVEAIAEQLQVADDWVLQDKRVTPAQFICLGDVSCPSAFKSWKLPAPISKKDFATLLQRSDLSLSIEEKDCMVADQFYCRARSNIKGHTIFVDVLQLPQGDYSASISVD